jgi:dCMP deaminase
MPVIHKGYLDFVKENRGDVYIVGKDLIANYKSVFRDLRLIDPELCVRSLVSIFPKRSIQLADEKVLHSWKYSSTLMPDDEICRDLAQKKIGSGKVVFKKVFLRWNKNIILKKMPILPDQKITRQKFDRSIMNLAKRESQKSADWWRVIGALLIKDGKIILRAHNEHMPTDYHLAVNGDPRVNFDSGEARDIFTSIHAEANLLAQACNKGISTAGLSIYQTTFPCSNCARLIAKSGIKNVYYSEGYAYLDAKKILDHFEIEVIQVI